MRGVIFAAVDNLMATYLMLMLSNFELAVEDIIKLTLLSFHHPER
jgi:hypothetical protein